jgi:plastocyanin
VRRAALLVLVAALAVPSPTAARPKKHRSAPVTHRGERVRPIAPAHGGRSGRPKPPKPPRVPVPTPPPPKPRPLAHLQVVAREWSVTPSRLTLPAGRVAVELDNFGQDPHNLRVERVGDPATGFTFTLTRPRTQSTQKLDLGPGTWKLYCTLPGHEELGMRAFVTVTG